MMNKYEDIPFEVFSFIHLTTSNRMSLKHLQTQVGRSNCKLSKWEYLNETAAEFRCGAEKNSKLSGPFILPFPVPKDAVKTTFTTDVTGEVKKFCAEKYLNYRCAHNTNKKQVLCCGTPVKPKSRVISH